MEQLRKEKEEERQIEELRRLQSQSGLNIKTHGERVDWMYEGVHAQGPTSEEYLLGKKYEGNLGGEQEDVLKLENKEAVGSIYLNSKVNEEMEERARLREDPLVAIMRREQIARQKVLDNPVEMAKISKNAKEMRKLKKWRKKQAKKDKKRRKKERKKEKRSRKKDKDADEDSDKNGNQSDDNGEEEVSKRDESPPARALPPAMGNKYGLILNPNASPPPVKVRNASPSPISEKEDDDRRRKRSRSRSREKSRRRSGGRSGNRRQSRSRDRQRSRSRGRNRRRDRRRDSRSPPRRERWRKRDRSNEKHGSDEEVKPKRKLTREERLAKLREMQDDAEAHEDAKLDRVRKAKKRAMKEEKEDKSKRNKSPEASSASFIRQMNKQIYSGRESLEERLKKNKHYRQKGGDAMNAESFMSR